MAGLLKRFQRADSMRYVVLRENARLDSILPFSLFLLFLIKLM